MRHRLPLLVLSLGLTVLCATTVAQSPMPDTAEGSAAGELGEDLSRPSAEAAPKGKVAGPRELLELYGIDASHFARLVDGQPWEAGEDEILMKIFYRLPSLRGIEMQRWAQPLSMAELTGRPDSHRGEVYRLEGRAVSVDTLHPVPEIARRLGLSRYYRVELELSGGHRAAVFAREIPIAWTKDAEWNEPAAALGFFLKIEGQEDAAVPVFAAHRIAWYPDTLLGKLGMDVGLLDRVWAEEMSGGPSGTGKDVDIAKLRLSGKDREAFYELLAAAGRAQRGQLIGEARKHLAATGRQSYSVVPLFNQPKTQLGELVVLTGNARRILRIPVDDQEIRSRLAMDHYYEIYLFTDDSQDNPLVFCVREVPAGMPTGEGPQFSEAITVAGFFFKTWAYRRTAQDDPGKVQWQLAPLLIGREALWLPAPSSKPDTVYEVVGGGIILLVVAGLALLGWSFSRTTRKSRQYTTGRRHSTDTGPTLAQMDFAGDGKPDFSGLAEGQSNTAPRPEGDSP